jgi:hypothetical protein
VRRTAKRIGQRLFAPLLGAIDRRLQDLAIRLERHTANLAADQGRRLDHIDERVRIDLRVIDEHLLAINKATHGQADRREPTQPVLDAGSGLVLVAHPGAPLGDVPSGYRIADIRSYVSTSSGGWEPVAAGERIDTLRIARLERS